MAMSGPPPARSAIGSIMVNVYCCLLFVMVSVSIIVGRRQAAKHKAKSGVAEARGGRGVTVDWDGSSMTINRRYS